MPSSAAATSISMHRPPAAGAPPPGFTCPCRCSRRWLLVQLQGPGKPNQTIWCALLQVLPVAQLAGCASRINIPAFQASAIRRTFVQLRTQPLVHRLNASAAGGCRAGNRKHQRVLPVQPLQQFLQASILQLWTAPPGDPPCTPRRCTAVAVPRQRSGAGSGDRFWSTCSSISRSSGYAFLAAGSNSTGISSRIRSGICK